jgi:predicted acetyltransferase
MPALHNYRMPRLVDPTVSVHASFVESVREVNRRPDALIDPAEFAEYVRGLIGQRFEETPRPAGYVPGTTLWWIEGPQFIGRLAIRHRLTPALEREGGHIGYDVRPTARRQGHATAMLQAALPRARALGIDRALITCDTDNIGSRKVIEKNGGEFIDEIDGKYRYWVPT